MLAPFYEQGSDLRKKALDRLGTAYWLGLMHKDIENHTIVQGITTAKQRLEYDDGMRAKARDHVMSVTIEMANKMILENPSMLSDTLV